MTPYRARLTDQDIRHLIKSDTEDERAAAAHKLCRSMGRTVLNEAERLAAQKILYVMANDAAELVRRALAVTLKSSDLLPRDLARRLALDVESVALPIISSSPVFNDDDLIEIVRSGSPLRQIAVAKRDHLTCDVTGVVAEEGCQAAVMAMVANDNADLAEPALGRVVDRFGAHEEVVASMAERRILPLAITQRLVELATDKVREHLIARLNVRPEAADQLIQSVEERATVDLIDQALRSEDLTAFIAHLHSRKILRPSLLLRALARGHMGFFERALAELTNLPYDRVWMMVHDAGPLGLRAIYDRAGLPPRLFAAFRAGVDVWRALHAEGNVVGSQSFRVKMLQRFLSQKPKVAPEDMAYLLERMDEQSKHAEAKPASVEEAA